MNAYVGENHEGDTEIDFGDDLEHISEFAQDEGEVVNLMVQRRPKIFPEKQDFETKCLIEDNICSLIIDGGSYEYLVPDRENLTKIQRRSLPGHRSNECPNRKMNAYVGENHEGDTEIDFGDDLEHISEFAQDEGEVVNLMVQRRPKIFPEKQDFETKCLIEDNICSLIIDGGSYKFLVRDIVKALKLPYEQQHNLYKLESVFRISDCKKRDKVKFAAATLQGRALTWWNGRITSIGIDAANGTSWAEVRKWLTDEFCPRSVLQRLEQELYNLKLKGTDIDGYTNRFHELALLCPRMVDPKHLKMEQYIRGLSKNIRGDVTSSRPAGIDEACLSKSLECDCKKRDKVKFAAATLQGRALTWWNGRITSIGIDAANGTSWAEVRKWLTDEFCPRSVLQRLEQELYNLKLKGTDIDGYTNRFHELALLCPRMVDPKQVKLEQYIRGLSKNIRGDVTSSRPAGINEAVRMAYQLMGQIIQDKTDEASEGEKRKGEGDRGGRGDNQRDYNCR
ncbi:putative reverse transcriptase domain-containing protein [Tanacetum coccineum]|uniref:Reverse transcriptase domain-containing protein n=1 Tax=Tanacetum coccineum TaxID=301880 RepID=A0ABQ5B377_9ASTR